MSWASWALRMEDVLCEPEGVDLWDDCCLEGVGVDVLLDLEEGETGFGVEDLDFGAMIVWSECYWSVEITGEESRRRLWLER